MPSQRELFVDYRKFCQEPGQEYRIRPRAGQRFSFECLSPRFIIGDEKLMTYRPADRSDNGSHMASTVLTHWRELGTVNIAGLWQLDQERVRRREFLHKVCGIRAQQQFECQGRRWPRMKMTFDAWTCCSEYPGFRIHGAQRTVTFIALAMRIRRKACRSMALGSAKTPEAFSQGAGRFIDVDALIRGGQAQFAGGGKS